MPGAYFSEENFIDSRLKLSVDWAIRYADLHYRNIFLCHSFKIAASTDG